jgi:hypothetical protein
LSIDLELWQIRLEFTAHHPEVDGHHAMVE